MKHPGGAEERAIAEQRHYL